MLVGAGILEICDLIVVFHSWFSCLLLLQIGKSDQIVPQNHQPYLYIRPRSTDSAHQHPTHDLLGTEHILDATAKG